MIDDDGRCMLRFPRASPTFRTVINARINPSLSEPRRRHSGGFRNHETLRRSRARDMLALDCRSQAPPKVPMLSPWCLRRCTTRSQTAWRCTGYHPLADTGRTPKSRVLLDLLPLVMRPLRSFLLERVPGLRAARSPRHHDGRASGER